MWGLANDILDFFVAKSPIISQKISKKIASHQAII